MSDESINSFHELIDSLNGLSFQWMNRETYSIIKQLFYE